MKPELIEKIRKKSEEGISTREIAEELKISITTVLYWTNDEYRERAKKRCNEISTRLYKEGKSWAAKNPEKYRAWFREYQKKRYATDTEFRERIKESNRKRMAELREKNAKAEAEKLEVRAS
jgi:transposase